MTEPLHLLTVWNPAYQVDALEEHVQALRHWAAESRRAHERAEAAGTASEGPHADAYVWWGLVRSPNRVGDLTEEVRASLRRVQTQLAAGDVPETHLYITDFQSLYVADLLDVHIVETDGPLPDDEYAHVPDYYGEKGLACEAWFQLADVRSLVRRDLPQVAAQLRQLLNANYHDRPVSLYGGMVDLPLLVTETRAQAWFDLVEREEITDGRLWVEWDSMEAGGVADMERQLRDDLFGREAWTRLDPLARRFIASAEKTFRDHRDDPGYDFGPVVVAFSKALEMQLRQLLRHYLRHAGGAARFVNGVDLVTGTPTLGVITEALRWEPGGSATASANYLKSLQGPAASLVGELSGFLHRFTELRNDATHEKFISLADVQVWRNALVGVGSDGWFVRIARAVPPQP
jgi:hypothetical protein